MSHHETIASTSPLSDDDFVEDSETDDEPADDHDDVETVAPHIAKLGDGLIEAPAGPPDIDAATAKALHFPQGCSPTEISVLAAAAEEFDTRAAKALRVWADSFGPFDFDPAALRRNGTLTVAVRPTIILTDAEARMLAHALDSLLVRLPTDRSYCIEFPDVEARRTLVFDPDSGEHAWVVGDDDDEVEMPLGDELVAALTAVLQP